MKHSRFLNLFLVAALFVGAAVALTACNTVEGVGEDLAAAARTVKKAL